LNLTSELFPFTFENIIVHGDSPLHAGKHALLLLVVLP
jgi:hypothetical protein